MQALTRSEQEHLYKRPIHILLLVYKMRQKQQQYIRTHNYLHLEECKKLQIEVDKTLSQEFKDIHSKQKELF